MKKSWSILFFIAQSLQNTSSEVKRGLSSEKAVKPITFIATACIALAMLVNIFTIAIVRGFQQEVSHKVIGFGSHIAVQKVGESSIMESSPLQRLPSFEQKLKSFSGLTSVQPVAYKPALLRSSSRKEQKEILGVVLKGVTKNYDWSFFKPYLKEGTLPVFKDDKSIELLLSRRVAKDLGYQVNDTISAFFVRQQPVQRNFRVVGIFETGLEEFDKELVYCHLPQVQQLNDWGIQVSIEVDDTLTNGDMVIRAVANGGNGNYRYDWGKGFENYTGFRTCPKKDSTYRVIVSDFWNDLDEKVGDISDGERETALSDTAYLKLTINGNKQADCSIVLNEENQVAKKYTSEDGLNYSIDAGGKQLLFESFPGKGSFRNYVGAYELNLTDLDELDEKKLELTKMLLLNPNMPMQTQVKTIKDQHPDMFTWLEFLDINLMIVIFLMLLIGIVNMCSALLVMILARTQFIGVMKSIGASNQQIRRLFLIHFGKLILKGMFWGNLIGFGGCLLQKYFHIIPLDPKVYYLNAVPVEFSWTLFFILNLVTIVICLISLILPTLYISKISPAQAVKYE